MKAIVKCGNVGTTSEYYFILVVDGESVRDWFVAQYAPNNWKTAKAAERWATKHGYIIENNLERETAPHDERRKQMKQYRVKTEKIEEWTNESLDELIVTDAEIADLARGWGKSVEELLEDVEEI